MLMLLATLVALTVLVPIAGYISLIRALKGTFDELLSEMTNELMGLLGGIRCGSFCHACTGGATMEVDYFCTGREL
eukprot:13565631-Ditylum_brightwellii.AAC.1